MTDPITITADAATTTTTTATATASVPFEAAAGAEVPQWFAHRVPCAPGPTVLALGAWFKNTVCVAYENQALVSGSVGDLDSVDACVRHDQTVQAVQAWLRQQQTAATEPVGIPVTIPAQGPVAIAHDLHPDFHSTRSAALLAAQWDVPLIAVQHHHAHIAAVCAEHGERGPVLGLALDGVGLGADGTAWGGELLRVERAQSQRIGHLCVLPMPGGERAAREPWRMAAAVLHRCGRGDTIAARFPHQPLAAGVAQLLASDTRCPPTSSLGRVFDAAAALLGLCEVMAFEAQAPIALERAATVYGATVGPCAPLAQGWRVQADGQLDLLPLLSALAEGLEPGYGAALFHATLVAALSDWLQQAAQRTGVRTVAAGGGCLFNRLLVAGLQRACMAADLSLLLPCGLLPGDCAIALGQAAVARAVLEDL